MTPEEEAESIRKRMSELRRELTIDVRDVGRSARAMANPAYYIKKFPWATMAVAAGVGYLLIPKKKPKVELPDAKVLAEIISKNKGQIEAAAASGKETKGMVESLLLMGVTWAAREGLKYIGQQLTSVAAKRARAEETTSEPPVQEPSETNG